jgi:hypothetical protein
MALCCCKENILFFDFVSSYGKKEPPLKCDSKDHRCICYRFVIWSETWIKDVINIKCLAGVHECICNKGCNMSLECKSDDHNCMCTKCCLDDGYCNSGECRYTYKYEECFVSEHKCLCSKFNFLSKNCRSDGDHVCICSPSNFYEGIICFAVKHHCTCDKERYIEFCRKYRDHEGKAFKSEWVIDYDSVDSDDECYDRLYEENELDIYSKCRASDCILYGKYKDTVEKVDYE